MAPAWREETASDLEDAIGRLSRLIKDVSGEPTPAQLKSIWMSYLDVEKSIAFIRLDIDEESPGRSVNLRRYFVPDERQAMAFALGALRKGSESFRAGDFRRAIGELRDCRNYLRALIREKRLKPYRAR
ncbi:MAG TPA: hypothetical protein VEB67_02890 [Nitrososphaerales archaeon]|nr:hypothetical protein [Nitrososphaerales archaeon]